MAVDINKLQKRSSKLTEHTALLLALFSLIGAAGLFFMSYRITSYGLLSAGFINLIAFITSLFACLHAYIERTAAQEALGNMSIKVDGSELFEDHAPNQGDRMQIWHQFERWFVPMFTLFLILLELGIAFYLWGRLAYVESAKISPIKSEHFNYGFIIIWGTAVFFYFILGKYSSGLAFRAGRRQLRAPSSLMIFSAFYLLFTIGIFLLAKFAIDSENIKITNPDPLLLYSGIVIMGIFAVDQLGGFILSFYRPKIDFEDTLPLYENRLAGLCSQPEGLWQGIAEIVDYQFGFKLSETHFYNFCIKALVPLILFQVITLAIISCFVVIPAGKRGFVERFGKEIGAPLKPGLHFKLPWPIERIYQGPADQIKTIAFGSYLKKEEKQNSKNNLWTDLSPESQLFITAKADFTKPVNKADSIKSGVAHNAHTVINLVAASGKVQYIVAKPKAYYYQSVAPKEILKELTERELITYLSTHDGLDLLQGNIKDFNTSFSEKLQDECNNLKLGIEIVSVVIENLQPPTKGEIVDAFQQLVISEQKSKTMVNNAQEYANKLLPAAKSKASELIVEAKNYKVKKISSIKAEADVFQSKYKLQSQYKSLYSTLAYLETINKALKHPKKIIISVDKENQVLQFDLKSEFNPELLDMAAPENKESK